MNWFHIAVQIDSTHWLVIHENGFVSTVMDSADFLDLIINEAKSRH